MERTLASVLHEKKVIFEFVLANRHQAVFVPKPDKAALLAQHAVISHVGNRFFNKNLRI